MDIYNADQQNFEPYESLTSEFVDNQDTHGQIENHETGEPIYSEDTESTEHNLEVWESILTSGDFMSKIATDEEIAANIRSLNKKATYRVSYLIKLFHKDYFIILNNQKNHVFSFWVQQGYLL